MNGSIINSLQTQRRHTLVIASSEPTVEADGWGLTNEPTHVDGTKRETRAHNVMSELTAFYPQAAGDSNDRRRAVPPHVQFFCSSGNDAAPCASQSPARGRLFTSTARKARSLIGCICTEHFVCGWVGPEMAAEPPTSATAVHVARLGNR